jgi:hypothetical protein
VENGSQAGGNLPYISLSVQYGGFLTGLQLLVPERRVLFELGTKVCPRILML